MNKIMLASMMLILVSASAVFAENETTNETESFNDSLLFNDSDLFDNSTLGNDTDIDFDNSTLSNDTDIGFDNSTLSNDTIVNDSIRDSEILSTNPGVVLRFSQLHRQLSLRIDQANIIIASVNDSSVAEQLSSIVEALEALKTEASYYTDENQEYDLRQAAIDFVYLKKESIDLVSEFREISHNYFQEGHLSNLRNRIKNLQAVNAALEAKISRMIKIHNALKVRNMVGEIDNETINGIMNGSITKNQISNAIKNRLENMNETIKNRIVMNIKENIVRNNINASAKRTEALNNAVNITQRIRQNVQERIEDYKEKNPNSSIAIKARAVINARGNK